MAGVDASVLRGDLGECDDFIGGAFVPCVVLQACGEPKGSGLHLLCHELLHARDLGGRRVAEEIFAHDLLAQGAVSDHAGDVNGGGSLVELGKEVRERILGLAVGPDSDGGDALSHGALGRKVLEDHAVGVAVHVDETRRERKAMLINDGFALARSERRRDCTDAVSGNADVAVCGRLVESVIDGDVFEEEVGGEAARRTEQYGYGEKLSHVAQSSFYYLVGSTRRLYFFRTCCNSA